MKVIKARINWNLEWSNDAKLEILVDKIPSHDELVYRAYPNGGDTLYYAEKGGYVSYLYHKPSDQTGFGGRTFNLNVLTDSPLEVMTARVNGEKPIKKIEVRGPWSSNSGSVNTMVETKCVEVTLTDKEEVWERGHTFYGGNVTVSLARKALRMIHPKLKMLKTVQWDDPYYVIDKKQKEELGL